MTLGQPDMRELRLSWQRSEPDSLIIQAVYECVPTES